jgi:hypothetical protein
MMVVCSRCGKLGHADVACGSAGLAPVASSSMPALGDLGGSGAFPAENSASRSLRLLKTQLQLAVGQREEDPERVWLELVSIRERLGELVEQSKDDPILADDVERFRGRLHDKLCELMQDVGDEMIAPLYSWVDLLRQRVRLEQEVETARARVAEARAARGLRSGLLLATEDEVGAAIASAETELAAWRVAPPLPPSPDAVEAWQRAGGDALRARLPSEPVLVRSRAEAALSTLGRLPAEGSQLALYARSWLERAALAGCAAAALGASVTALLGTDLPTYLGLAGGAAWVLFAAVAGLSVAARRRAGAERRATIDRVWHHILFTEHVAALSLEVAWLRTLASAVRAQSAFNAHAGEGGQLAELARWRPDLEPAVVEAARSSIPPPHERA